ncbi:MAG TPA: hypothetical protein VE344_07620 [Methylomirabilota bacterium]|nr:hypothetical protein [Methylomirabilota bacterium]
MSDVSDLGLDLENLFQPAWTQAKTESKRFEKFTGLEGVKPERRFSDKPGERRGPRRDSGGGERRGGPPRGGSKFGGGDRKKSFGQRDDNRGERRERPEPPAPLPEISVTFVADENGVESLSRQIKMTGRCYPLFQIAQLVLDKPERYSVQLGVKKKSDGAIAQQLFVCALDDTPWLSEDEAVEHVLKNHFATFYQAERTATEPPKGTYTFVAQCGLSGAILGPPNYHDYQNQLRKLHTEKFSRMPFDMFKARVKIVKDEVVVKKWIEEQSFKTEYACLNVPEPLKLPTMEEVEKHFRATHKDSIIKQAEKHTVSGVVSRNLKSRELYRLVRTEWENQKHFPLQLATALSKQFASLGLQFFKVNKMAVHVSVARPQFLDLETTPVSENIKRIIGFISTNPRCTRRKLIESLAPTPPKPAVLEVKPDEPKVDAPDGPTPEQTALIADLHWLIHQGHVLEFADGRMETAKKPLPRPPKPEKKTDETKSAEEKPATEGEIVSTDPVPQAEAEISAPTGSSAPVPKSVQSEATLDEAKPTEEVPSPS